VLYPNIQAKNVVPHIIQGLLPVGLKGLAIAGLLAVTMSTIDSYLHAAGYTIVHDVIKPIYDKNNATIHELRWIKYATVLISFAAIGVGLWASDIFTIVLIPFGFTGPLLMFPVLSGIMGLKTDKRSFYIATGVTLVAFGLAKLLLPSAQSHFITFITIIANGVSFFGMHLVQHKGFITIKRS